MKPERFTAGVFVFLICVMMFLSLSSIATRLYDKMTNENNSDMGLGISANIAWAELYPFSEAGMNVKSHKKPSFMSYFHYVVGYVKRELGEYTSNYLPGYRSMVESAKKYEDIIAWNMIPVSDYNAVMKLKDGYLTSYTMSLDVTHDAEAVKGLSDFCTERGISFMYINFPAKICKSADKEISGVLDFTNQNADKLLDMLKESGVRNYDFRKNLHEAGMNHHEAFFITDHHWKPETGLWAAGEILKILRGDLGLEVAPDILRPENFSYDIYPQRFVGSQGKKLTLARVKPEDFTVIHSKFRTLLHFSLPQKMFDRTGDLSSFYDMRLLRLRENVSYTCYSAYGCGDNALLTIDNELSRGTERIVIVRDSFSDCVLPFAALGVRHIDAIDLRQFSGSVRTFIEAVKPDAVIVMYCATVPGRNLKPSATNGENKFYNFQ